MFLRLFLLPVQQKDRIPFPIETSYVVFIAPEVRATQGPTRDFCSSSNTFCLYRNINPDNPPLWAMLCALTEPTDTLPSHQALRA